MSNYNIIDSSNLNKVAECVKKVTQDAIDELDDNKVDKVTNATAGNLVTLASDGSISDAGISLSDIEETLDSKEDKFVGTEFAKVLFDYSGYSDTEATVKRWSNYDIVVGGIDYRYYVGRPEADSSVKSYENNVKNIINNILIPVLAIKPNFRMYWYIDLGVSTGGGSDNRIRSAINYIAHIGGEFVKEDTTTYGVDSDGLGVNIYSGGGCEAIGGVFFDDAEAGFGVTRNRINMAIEHCHLDGIHAFVNGHQPVGTLMTNTVSSQFNPDGLGCALNEDDYFLMESCFSTAGGETTVICDSSAYSDLYTWANQYRSLGYGKAITLNYITVADTDLEWDAINCIQTYCVVASFIGGANGVAFNGAALGINSVINNWVEPDIVKAVHSSTPNQVYSSGYDKSVVKNNMSLSIHLGIITAPDNHVGVVGRELFEKYLYFVYNGSKGANAWETIYSVEDRLNATIEKVSMQYNDDPSLMTMILDHNVAGTATAVSRADHTHKAGPYIYARNDDWYFPSNEDMPVWEPSSNFTNNVVPYSTITYDTETRSGKIVRDGGQANAWWDLKIAKVVDMSTLAGRKIEFGIKLSEDTNVTDSGMYIQFSYGSSVTKIQVKSTNYGGVYDSSKKYLYTRLDIPDNASGTAQIYILKSQTTGDATTTYTIGWDDFYVFDITDYIIPWYSDIYSVNSPWSLSSNASSMISSGNMVITDNIGKRGKINVISSKSWWDITLCTVASIEPYRGKTLEYGIKLKNNAPIPSSVRLLFQYNGNNIYMNLNGNNYGGVYGAKNRYLYGQYLIPEDATGQIKLYLVKNINNSDETYELTIDDYYIYDLSEDVPEDNARTSNTTLQISRVETLPVEDIDLDMIYFAKDEIGVSDNNGNMIVYGSGTYSKPSGGIPKTDLSSDVQTSLGKADTALQTHQDISGKVDKVTNATSGNLVTLSSDGNINDSGTSINEIEKAVEITQSEYDALPDTKLTDGITRYITDVEPFIASDVVYSHSSSTLLSSTVQGAIDELDSKKVDKVSGKVLSTNDFTNDYKTKVDNSASVSSLNSEISNRQSADNTLSSRIDSLSHLSEGSTTGDAELVDGRVDANGKIYPNIGGAIRGQYTELKEDLKNQIISSERFRNRDFDYLCIPYIENKFVFYANGELMDAAGWNCYYMIPVNPNTKLFNAAVGATHVAFFDINKNYISGHYDDSISVTAFTTPANCYYITFSYGKGNVDPTAKFALIEVKNTSYIVDAYGKGDFSTITEAINNALDGDVIYIKNGVYNEQLNLKEKRVSLIGESMEGTVLTYSGKDYYYPPMNIAKGHVENMTVYADNSQGSGNAYCAHIDWNESQYESLEFINVKFINEAGIAVVGIGMRPHFNLSFRNCYFISTNQQETFYCHTSEPIYDDMTGQNVLLDSCRFCTNGNSTIHLQSQEHAGALGVLTMINNMVVLNNATPIYMSKWDSRNLGVNNYLGSNDWVLHEMSCMNNVSLMNK